MSYLKRTQRTQAHSQSKEVGKSGIQSSERIVQSISCVSFDVVYEKGEPIPALCKKFIGNIPPEYCLVRERNRSIVSRQVC